MSEFRIVISDNPNAWAGADSRDNSAVKPVITCGDMQKWSFKDDCLVLEDTWFCKREGDKLVVTILPGEATKWKLIPITMGPPAASYWIYDAETRMMAWTATSFDPEKPIVLAPVVGHIKDEQQWSIPPLKE